LIPTDYSLPDVQSFSTVVAVQFLACISTVIDVATRRPTPTPFGTQHIALLLAAWSPVVVFGMFSSIFISSSWILSFLQVVFRL
jgi:hypothetical protein